MHWSCRSKLRCKQFVDEPDLFAKKAPLIRHTSTRGGATKRGRSASLGGKRSLGVTTRLTVAASKPHRIDFSTSGATASTLWASTKAPPVLKSRPEKPNFVVRQMLRIGR